MRQERKKMTANPLGSTTITQIGIIVSNLEDAARAWAIVLGRPVPEIVVTDPVEQTHAQYGGQPTPAMARMAFFPLGQVTLELIEPVGEPSTWRDQLDRHGQSLHHLAFEVEGMADRLAALVEHGLPVVQQGDYQGGRYAYLDGQGQYGAIVELLEND
jgi:catechol 2,3-dioxygenase-like lactoylglutathione lyase family enzyme